jgi:hypothetical protein
MDDFQKSKDRPGGMDHGFPLENFCTAMPSTLIIMGMAAAKVTPPASMDRVCSLPSSVF